MANKEILIFHPDINRHKTNNEYTKNIYNILADAFEIKSLEWYIKHPFSSNVKYLYLNWYENTVGKESVSIQKIQYLVKHLLLCWAKMRKIKIIYIVHNKTPHNIEKESELYQKAAKGFMQSCLKIADRIVVLCNHTSDYLQSEFQVNGLLAKVCFVPHGKYTKYNSDLTECRKLYGIAPDVPIFCFVGRMDRYKNIDIIIKAFFEADVKGKLLLVGKCDSAYQNVILPLIKDERVFNDFRFVSDEEMSCIMQTADAVVLPYENTSLNSGIMINAFSNGTTVIGTSIEMLKDFPQELVYGYNYSSVEDHIQELAKCMKTAEGDFFVGLLKQNGAKLESIIEDNNSWEMVNKNLIEVIKE